MATYTVELDEGQVLIKASRELVEQCRKPSKPVSVEAQHVGGREWTFVFRTVPSVEEGF